MNLEKFKVSADVFHELVVEPMFADGMEMEGSFLNPSLEEGDWTVIDSPKHKVAIIDVHGHSNLLKRRDATCKVIYSPVASLGNRYVYGEDLYAATEDCLSEFYQGSFEDYKNEDWEIFGSKVMPIISKGIYQDIYTNKYFGDVSRPSDPGGIHSWNKFDGISTHYADYVSKGIVDAPTAIPAGVITPTNAYNLLLAMYSAQPERLDDIDDEDKVFYVNKKIYDAYGLQLLAMPGAALSLADLQSGRATLYFNGIQVKHKKWNGVLKALNGGVQAHYAILTVRGNFIFKTDSTYGGGAKRDEAVKVWYSDDDDVWRRKIYVQGGTQIIAPQLSVLAMTNIS